MTGTTLPLCNGVGIPTIGPGILQTPPEEMAAAAQGARGLGHRHFDTAAAYGHERAVGENIRRSDVAREDVFVETPLWIGDEGFEAAVHGFDS